MRGPCFRAGGSPVLRPRSGTSAQMILEGVIGFDCAIEAEKSVERLFQILQEPEKLAAMRASPREFALAELGATDTTRVDTRASRERMKSPRARNPCWSFRPARV